MNNLIEVVILDKEGYETDRRDFDTQRQAKTWAKECGLSADFWNRRAESESDFHGWAKENVYTLQLLVNGEVRADWFPEF